MFGRLTLIQGSPERYDDALRAIQAQVTPAIKQVPGLISGHWGLDRSTGKAAVWTVFESEEALRASEETVRQIREKTAADLGAEVLSVESYEVVASI
jgi:hypothetical protein